ncbi:MAG TPA: transglutaminase domain-containing protein [Cyclobacteriaceae bacterium]|nr:transglutaminase domain-containing protein [Cyclobacteriaceae bacterium]
MKYSFLFFLAILCSITVTAQKNTNVEKAKLFKTYPQNKKAKVVASTYTSGYTFSVSGEKVNVVNEEKHDLIALEGNYDHVEHVYYNDHIKIEDFSAKHTTTGKTIRPQTACGNYEVGDIFYSDSKVCSYLMNFLYEGSEITLNSKVKYDDPKYLTYLFFHDSRPIENREITVEVPANINIELVEKNFEGFDITKNKTTLGTKTVYTFKAKRLEAQKNEDNSLGALYYYPHIIVLTKEFTTSSGKKNVLSSVNDLYDWYSNLVKQVSNDPAVLKQEVERLTANAKTSEEKMRAIYYWIQDNIKYIAFEDGIAGFRPETAQAVYQNRYGDCKGMANLTKEMLKLAGFDARLTWIGTNRIPYTYDIPSLSVDNHMICTVFINDKFYILDSTEKYIALGKNAERIQGKEMLIEDGPKFIRKFVPVADEKANSIDRSETLVLENETLKGEGELVMNGEAKKSVLYFSTNVRNEDQKKLFSTLAVSDYSNTDKVEVTQAPAIDRENPLNVKYKFVLGNKVSKFNNDIYIDIDWAKMYQNHKMEDDRVTDFYFNRKVKTKTIKKFKVPPGYKVSHVPKNMSKVYDDFAFNVTFKQVGNEVHYQNEIVVKGGIVKKKRFSVWNECIKELKEIYNDQIVITKAK